MVSRILLLLILTSSVCAGTFELNQTQSFYEAVENQTITLEWTFTIRRPIQNCDIYCDYITDHRMSVVYQLKQGVQYPDSQDPDFTGRVQFDEDAFREGRLRVHVSRLRTEDSGLYQCEMVTEYGSNVGTCRLSVSAAANETQTLRPGPERPGPEGPKQRRPAIWFYGGTRIFVRLAVASAAVLVIMIATAVRKCLNN